MSTHLRTIIFVIGMMLGIICGETFLFSTECAFVSLIIIFIQLVFLKIENRGKVKGFASIFVLLLFSGLFLGIITVQFSEDKLSYVCVNICTFEAKVTSSPEIKNNFQVFKIHPLGLDDKVLDVAVSTELYPKYKIGESLKVTGKVSVPKVISQHNDKKYFDYTSFLLIKNIGSEVLYPKIEITDVEVHSLNDFLGRWKEDMIEKIKNNTSSPGSDLASGMLFGKSDLSKELNQTFRVAGLSHIIVLSGFNIAIVISFILFVFAFFPLVFRIFLASISVIFFVIMVGGEASVVRATLMAFIALLATLLGREYLAKQALIISLFLILLYDPYSLLQNISLHLSFLATAGIVYLNDSILIILRKVFLKSFLTLSNESFLEILSTTLSAYFTTLPYLMYTFGSFSVYALLANILVLPFVPVAMLVSFFVVLFSYLSNFAASVFGFLDNIIIGFIIWVARFVEHLPFSYINLDISFFDMCFIYVFIFSLIYFLYKKTYDETLGTEQDKILTDIIYY